MEISVVAGDLPHPEGTAVGRVLWAWCEGARALGHDLQVWVWQKSVNSPVGPVPEWCNYEPFNTGAWPIWREHLLYILFRPRGSLARAGWRPPEGNVVVADGVASSPAVERFERSATIFHYRAAADAFALRNFKLSVVQDVRAERRAGRRPALVLAHSERVARHLRRTARVAPVGCAIPPEPVPVIEAPIAGMIADWSWPPNMAALSRLLGAWPSVREIVPTARLLLAGRMMRQDAIGTIPGVQFLGPVAKSADLFSQASVLAFPCPPTSGPKVKVLDAMAHGLPVVTTKYGVEGLVLAPGEGAAVVRDRDFEKALVGLLLSPERRAALAKSGRAAIEAHHSPVASAKVRLQAFEEAFGSST